ncbi:MAG: choice-of-anchor J domain-containing protein [Clostridia bacterium]|nr:choice-of-anchor J domain-containing protein [Clostridia bacterium]
MKKRILSLIIAFALVLGLLPLTAIAASAASELDNALNVSGGNLKFTSTGDYPWTVVSDGVRVYAQSGNAGVSDSTSVLTLSVSPTSDTAVSFDFMAWGEGISTFWDSCSFYIDSTLEFQFGAYDNNWETYTAPLSAGAHTLRWEYMKDDTNDDPGDFFAIDNVKIGVERFALYAKGTQVTTANCRDILGDGKLSFNPATYTLTVAGTETAMQALITSEIEGLTIKTTVGATFMNMGSGPAVSLKGSTLFTSEGNNRLSLMAFSGNALNFIGSNTILTFDKAKFYAQGTTGGIVSTGSNNSLKVNFSAVEAQAESGAAVTGFSGGITYSECDLVYPENAKIASGQIRNSDNSAAKIVKFNLDSVTLYGICTYDFDSDEHDDEIVSFESAASSALTKIADAPYAYAAAYAYGKVFFFTYPDEDEDYAGGDLWMVSANDPSDVAVVSQVFDGEGTPASMTFDYTKNLFYFIVNNNADSRLYSFDPVKTEVNLIGDLGDAFFGICADENGKLYGINGSGALYTFNKSTAETTIIGTTGYACQYVQDIAYDFDNGVIYWARLYSTEDGGHGLYRINKETGEATLLDKIGTKGCEITGMFMIPADEPAGGFNANVTGVTITPSAYELRVGQFMIFQAGVLPILAENRNVIWGTTDDKVITVNQYGIATAVGVGTATVTVTTEQGGFTAGAVVTVLPGKGDLVRGFYFEIDPVAEGWTFVDSDGDGHNWGWNESSSYILTIYEGEGVLYSESYINGTGALTPDNWAISPAVTIPADGATVTFYARGQDSSDYSEHFAIYAGTSPDISKMTQLGDYVTTSNYVDYTAALDRFAGQTIYLAFRHYDCTDQFILDLDAVEIYGYGSGSSVMYGDMDDDGQITVADALRALRIAAKLSNPTEDDMVRGDVDFDGEITVADALKILRVAARLATPESLQPNR